MSYPVPGYPRVATSRPQGSNLAGGQIDVSHVSGGLLRILEKIGEQLGKTVVIISGYRTDAYSQSVGGFAGDPHSKGIAVDAEIGGLPIGAYPQAVNLIHSFGARSGATDFQYHGKSDPAHVDLYKAGGDVSSNGSNNGSVTWEDLILKDLGAPLSGFNEQFLRAWELHEGGQSVEHINNPLNTTRDRAQYPGYPKAPAIPMYPSIQVGAQETADTIREGYPAIFHALKSDSITTEIGSSSFLANLNKWVSGDKNGPNPRPTAYTAGIAKDYAKGSGTSQSASDWTSYDIKDLGKDVGGALDGPFGWIKSYIMRGLLILVGSGLVLMGLYFIVRAMGGPSIGVADKVATVASRGAVKPSKGGRFKGQAAAGRGEEVTTASAPEPVTRSDRKQLRANERTRAFHERNPGVAGSAGQSNEIPY